VSDNQPGTFAFTRYEQVEDAINTVVEEEFYQSDFFTSLHAGVYSMRQLRHFAIQYHYYSRHFPRVLGAAISAMAPIDTWWVPLADNLWDEAGRGLPNKSHEKLYQTFLLSVDPEVPLDENGIPPEAISPAVEKAIETFIRFFYHATPLEAMAAVGLGSELFAGGVMGSIGRGLLHPAYNRIRPLNVLFWEAHADEHEPRHYQLCKDILVRFSDPADLQVMYQTGCQIARSEALMYKELHEEMSKL
jgi:pyrroloquinoline quinone (PQQ) biosynthesis protein C